ncbi:MAG: hypothetical protein ACLP62_02840 [Acidimicrobiales bacterium]
MAGKLRYFLYRDDSIVSQFLEQLEGGAYDEESIRRSGSSGTGLSAGVSAGPISGKALRDRSNSEQSELNLRQTGPSRFSRFYDLANDDQAVQVLDACDDAIWDQLAQGEVIDLGVTIAVPEALKSLAMVGGVAKLMPLFDAISSMASDDGEPMIDSSEIAAVKDKLPVIQQTAMATRDAPVQVIASLAADPRFKVFMRLKRSGMQVEDLPDLEGDARLVATIQSKVGRGKSVDVGPILPGLPVQSRAQRRRSSASEPTNLTLRYPGAIVTPIALFR